MPRKKKHSEIVLRPRLISAVPEILLFLSAFLILFGSGLGEEISDDWMFDAVMDIGLIVLAAAVVAIKLMGRIVISGNILRVETLPGFSSEEFSLADIEHCSCRYYGLDGDRGLSMAYLLSWAGLGEWALGMGWGKLVIISSRKDDDISGLTPEDAMIIRKMADEAKAGEEKTK